MNLMQEKLLCLVKEIDEVCTRHSIPYFLSGGSVIGALRHKGFIPWDDDIDILMDSKYWPALYRYLKAEMPANRSLGCPEDETAYSNNTVCRYCDTSSTNIHKNEMLGDAVAGVVVDIILMDSFIGGEDAYREHLTYLALMGDIANPYYSYLHRFDFNIPYAEWKEKERRQGRTAVLRELDGILRCNEDTDADYYVVRWAAGPNIYPKKWFGTPKRVPFEDTVLPIPEMAVDFLRELYGDEWYEVPKPDQQDSHDTVLDMKHGYEEYFKEYVSRLDRESVLRVYEEGRLSRLATAKAQRQDEKDVARIKLLKEKLLIERRIVAESIDVDRLFIEGDIDTLKNLYGGYMQIQASQECLGGEMWDGLLRRLDPVYVDLGDETFSKLLWIWMANNKLSKAYKTLRARNMVLGAQMSASLKKTACFIDRYRLATTLYYADEYHQSLSVVQSLIPEQEIPLCSLMKLQIRLTRIVGLDDVGTECRIIESALQAHPNDGELIKYRTDRLFERYGIEATYKAYLDAYPKTRNGIIWNEIRSIMNEHADKILRCLKAADPEIASRYCKKLIKLGCDSQEIPLLYCQILFDNVRNMQPKEGETEDAFEARRASASKKVESSILSFEKKAPGYLGYIELLRSYRIWCGKGGKYPDFEIATRKTSNYQELECLRVKLLATDANEEWSEEKNVLLVRILRKQGKVIEGHSVCLKLLAHNPGCDYAASIVKNDMRKMLRAIERAKYASYRDALIREWWAKYIDLETSIKTMLLLELISRNREDVIRSYLCKLLGGELGRIKVSPILDYKADLLDD